jgi:hypothetical protein
MSSIFQSAMSSLLGDLSFVRVFQDDMVIHSRSLEVHFDHFVEMSACCQEEGYCFIECEL